MTCTEVLSHKAGREEEEEVKVIEDHALREKKENNNKRRWEGGKLMMKWYVCAKSTNLTGVKKRKGNFS